MLLKPTLPEIAALSTAYWQHPRYQGCVGHWGLTEGSGSTVYDLSPTAAHGVLTNFTLPTAWAAGGDGPALVCDGVDDTVVIPHASALSLAGDLTFLCWARLDSSASAGSNFLLAKMPTTTQQNYYWAITDTGTIHFEYRNGSFREHDFPVTSFSLGTVYCYGLTILGTAILAYRDGVPVGAPQTLVSTLVTNTGALQFGTDAPAFGDVWNGRLVHVRIYARGCSPGEMASFAADPWLEFAATRRVVMLMTMMSTHLTLEAITQDAVLEATAHLATTITLTETTGDIGLALDAHVNQTRLALTTEDVTIAVAASLASHGALVLATDDVTGDVLVHGATSSTLAFTTDDIGLSLMASNGATILAMLGLITEDVALALAAHVAPLAASLTWLEAAAHAATLAQISGQYQPVLFVDFPAFMRRFTTHSMLFGAEEPWLARLTDGGVGAITRDLDELVDTVRLGGSSVVLVNENGFVDTFMQAPFLNTPAEIRLGFVDLAEEDFLLLFTGVIDRYAFTRPRMEFALIDASVKDSVNLNVPISPDLFPNAPSESRSKNIPIFLGVHVNAPVIQVSGVAATGALAFAMTTTSTSILMLEDTVSFPSGSTVTVGAESISYTHWALVNIGGRTYAELSGLTRGTPVTHAIGTVVTLTDLTPSYVTGFGVDTVNAVRVDGAAQDASDVSVSALLIAGHPVPVVQLLVTPGIDAMVTVDVNAAAPLLTFSVPLPPGVIETAPNLVTNGDFETGILTGWTTGGTGPVAEVRTAAASPAGLGGAYSLELRGSSGGVAKQAQTTVTTVVGERYAWRVRYHNAEPAPYWGGADGFIRGKSQAFVFVNPASDPLATFVLLPATNDWVTASGSFIATETSTVLTLWSYLTSPLILVSSFFDDVAIRAAPLPETSSQLVNGGFELGDTTGWTPGGTLEDFSVSNGSGIGLMPFEGTFLARLQGGKDVDGFIFQDVTTVVGQQYDYSVTSLNREFTFTESGFVYVYRSRAQLQVGTPSTPNLYATREPGGSGAWVTATGSFVATEPTARLTLLSHYESTYIVAEPFPSFFDAVTLMPTAGITPGMGVPSLYHNEGENPVDAILYMLALFYPTVSYDASAFTTARPLLSTMRFRGLFTNPGDSGTLLQRMGQQCKSLVSRTPSGAIAIAVLDSSRPVVAAFDTSNIIEGSFARTSTPVDALYTSFSLYFDTLVGGSTTPGDYAGVTTVTPTSTTAPDGAALQATCLEALRLYGRDHRYDFFADCISDVDTANQLLAWLVSRHAIRQDVLTFAAWLDAVPIQLGQVVRVEHPVLSNDGAAIEGEVIGWHYTPGAMQVELTVRTIGPAQDVGLVTPDPPIAHDDVATTLPNTPTVLDILFNDDAAAGAMLNVMSVDLDPTTPGKQTTFTDPDHGTFVVDSLGMVTFTPVTDYTGAAMATYTVLDNFGQVSNSATIAIMVTDVVSAICGWTFFQVIPEPADSIFDTGLHLLNAFETFYDPDTSANYAVSVTGDPSPIGGTGPVDTPGLNDIYLASRLLVAPMHASDEDGFIRNSINGYPHEAASGNKLTAMVAVKAYGDLLYVAFNTADSGDETVNAAPVIFQLANLTDWDTSAFLDTWVEAHDFGAGYSRVGAMAVHENILYVALEPTVPGTDPLDIWTYDGATWSLYASYDFGLSDLRAFCVLDGILYAGLNTAVDGQLLTVTGPDALLSQAYEGRIEGLLVRDGLLYINEREGSVRRIWTSTNGVPQRTLLHTFETETALLTGCMALGPGTVSPALDGALDGMLYVSLRDAEGHTQIWLYDGAAWTLSMDFDTEFLGVSALNLMPDGRLYAAFCRHLHTVSPPSTVASADIWYWSCYVPPIWALTYDREIVDFTAAMADSVPPPPDADIDYSTLTFDDLVFPAVDLTLSIDVDGVLTGSRTTNSTGGPLSTLYHFTDSLARDWTGTFQITFSTG